MYYYKIIWIILNCLFKFIINLFSFTLNCISYIYPVSKNCFNSCINPYSISGRCPFGYMKDPNNKNHLVINKEQAETVRLIFDLALKGNTYHYIAQELTKRKIKTPASYYNYAQYNSPSNK